MLVGHESIGAKLKNSIEQGRLHHVQLFIGPKSVGKTTLALHLGRQLVGLPEGTEMTHPDLALYLDNGEPFGIEQVRGLLARASQSFSSPYFVFVIENLGRLRPEALNALLKSLEEPAHRVIFFLTAHSDEAVLDTVRSRAQVSRFNTVSDETLMSLDSGGLSQEALLRYAMGRPGKWFRLVKDPEYFQAHQEIEATLNHFLKKPETASALKLSREAEKSPFREELLDLLLHLTRRCFLEGRYHFASLAADVEQARQDLEKNVNAKLALDHLFLAFTHGMDSRS